MSPDRLDRSEFIMQAQRAACNDLETAQEEHQRRLAEGQLVVSRVLAARGADPVPILWDSVAWRATRGYEVGSYVFEMGNAQIACIALWRLPPDACSANKSNG